jgi:dolichol-phosphate mannosyltransferase
MIVEAVGDGIDVRTVESNPISVSGTVGSVCPTISGCALIVDYAGCYIAKSGGRDNLSFPIFCISLPKIFGPKMRKIVIIPTYNECENIAPIIETVFSLPEAFDILVVDDGSPDGTAQIVKRLQSGFTGSSKDGGRGLFLLERAGKSGLGSAYLAGFRWALDRGYDYVFEMDADFSHNPDDLVKLYHTAISDAADVVIGSRYATGVNVVNWPMSRLLMSWFASRYVRFVTRMPVRDATAGFVCYAAKVLKTIDLDDIKMRGYGFQIEMKYTAWRLGFRIREVSIIFIDRTRGTSKMSGGIFGEALWGVLKLRFRRIKAA